MPNAIKYSTSAQTLALKKGNYWIGTGDVGKGPTSTTDYYNGITPPAGGYTIYLNKASGGPSIYTAANDSQLISLTNTIAGQTFATAAAAIDWYNSQADKIVLNADYPPIVTSGLTCLLDASFTPSYPTTGTTWYDLSGNGNNFTLYNGASFATDNNVKVISFDGVDDYARSNSTMDLTTTNQVTIISVWSQIDNTFGVMVYEHGENWNAQHQSTGAGGTVRYGGFGMYTNSNGNQGGISYANQQHNQYNGNISYSGANRIGPGNTTYNVHTVIHNISLPGADQTAYYGNGTVLTTTYPGSTINYGANNTENLGNEYMFLGKRGSSVPTGPYKLSLFLVYNKALSQSEITQNQNALKARYGL